MSKLIIQITFFLVATLNICKSFSQDTIVNNGAFSDPSFQKHFVLQMTEAYLLDFRETNDPKGFTKSEEIGYNIFKREVYGIHDSTLDYVKYYGTLLDTNDLKSGKVALEKYYNYIKNIKSLDYLTIDSLKEGIDITTKGSNFNIKFNQLASDVENFNHSEKVDPNIVDTANIDNKVVTEESYNSNWFYWLIIGLLIILVLILKASYETKIKEAKDRVHRREKTIKELEQENNSNITLLRKQRDDEKKTNEDLKKELDVYKAKLNQKSIVPDKLDQPSKESSKINNVVDKKTIYLLSPKSDKTFNGAEASSIKAARSLYEVILEGNSEKGTLNLINNQDMLELILNSPQNHLEMACDYQNEPEQQHRNVEMVKPGRVHKAGNDWKIESKVLIKFV